MNFANITLLATSLRTKMSNLLLHKSLAKYTYVKRDLARSTLVIKTTNDLLDVPVDCEIIDDVEIKLGHYGPSQTVEVHHSKFGGSYYPVSPEYCGETSSSLPQLVLIGIDEYIRQTSSIHTSKDFSVTGSSCVQPESKLSKRGGVSLFVRGKNAIRNVIKGKDPAEFPQLLAINSTRRIDSTGFSKADPCIVDTKFSMSDVLDEMYDKLVYTQCKVFRSKSHFKSQVLSALKKLDKDKFQYNHSDTIDLTILPNSLATLTLSIEVRSDFNAIQSGYIPDLDRVSIDINFSNDIQSTLAHFIGNLVTQQVDWYIKEHIYHKINGLAKKILLKIKNKGKGFEIAPGVGITAKGKTPKLHREFLLFLTNKNMYSLRTKLKEYKGKLTDLVIKNSIHRYPDYSALDYTTLLRYADRYRLVHTGGHIDSIIKEKFSNMSGPSIMQEYYENYDKFFSERVLFKHLIRAIRKELYGTVSKKREKGAKT